MKTWDATIQLCTNLEKVHRTVIFETVMKTVTMHGFSQITKAVSSVIRCIHRERQEEKIMNKRKTRIQKLTLAAFFVAIEILMAITPIGFIPVGAINITTMHLPVILSGIILGPAYGALTGFVFGFTSMLKATFAPNITSFCFSPFITVGGVHGNFASLFIAFVPRITLGVLSFYIYRALRRVKKTDGNKVFSRIAASAIAAGTNTLIHTLFVMGSIWLFFGSAYANAAGITVGAVIVAVLTSNGILEIVLASIVIPALVRALKPSLERMGFYDR